MTTHLSVFLHGVGRLNAATYAGAFLLLVAGTIAAGAMAALRVRRVSPVEILRAE